MLQNIWDLASAHPKMVFLPNLCVMQKNNARDIKHMPVCPVKCLPGEMRSLFHNGSTYLTEVLIFLRALILTKNSHFWMDTSYH